MVLRSKIGTQRAFSLRGWFSLRVNRMGWDGMGWAGVR